MDTTPAPFDLDAYARELLESLNPREPLPAEADQVELLTALLQPHEATEAEVAQARADALEVRRKTAEFALEVEEKQRLDPHWPRWRGAGEPGTEPKPEPAKKPRAKRCPGDGRPTARTGL